MYNPLSGSFANVWTEFNIPDLTKKVPQTLNVNVDMHKIIDQDPKDDLLPKTKMQCNKAVKLIHGINEYSQLDPRTRNHPNLTHSMPK